MFAWSPYDEQTRTAFTHELPLISMQVLASSEVIVVRDARGEIWSISLTGQAKHIRAGDGVDITLMRASRDGQLLAIGNEAGEVSVYRTTDWNILRILKFSGSIGRIEFSPTDQDILVSSEDDYVHLIELDSRRRLPWQDFKVAAHDIAYDPSGDIIAISARDGGNWFYSISKSTWSYHQDHEIELRAGQFSPRGTQFFSIDRDGMIIMRNMGI